MRATADGRWDLRAIDYALGYAGTRTVAVEGGSRANATRAHATRAS